VDNTVNQTIIIA